MTKTQWLFEYHGLRKKEDDDWIRLKRLIITLFGLNLYAKARVEGEEEDEKLDADRFIPLTMFIHPFRNEELLAEFFDDKKVEQALKDAEYEKLVDAGPEAFFAELEILDNLEDKEVVVEEDAGSFDPVGDSPKLIIND